jgi:hypothetical protein
MCLVAAVGASAQGLGGAGAIQGTVKDQTGAVVPGVTVQISNAVTSFKRSAVTDSAGAFAFTSVPKNPYHVSASISGFTPFEKDVEVRGAVPVILDVALTLASTTTAVEVSGHTEDVLEMSPTAHTDVDQSLIAKLVLDSGAGLNQVVTLASPGVVADSNGFFHPVGDHAQTQFSVDNQPVTDQQSRVYSNQISENAVASMEVITGVPPAEYGDKSALVVHIVTKSGLDQATPSGTATMSYGSFRSPSSEVNVGAGTKTFGNFLSLNTLQTDRYLDSPEFLPLHDRGSSTSLFDRIDLKTSTTDTLHLNLQAARSSFDVPNTLDQDALGQAQHQRIDTFNIAPGYVKVIGPSAVLTANAFVRRDHLLYTPSPDPFSDTPGSVSQDRTLTNTGGKVDVEYAKGAHDIKVGGTVSATRLDERFTIGFTDPAFNAPCLDATGAPVGDTTLVGPGQCVGAQLLPNQDFSTDLASYDLTRGGTPFTFNGAATIHQQAAYIQDSMKAGHATFNLGLRFDHYAGLSSASMAQPRLGASYLVSKTGTVLRASFGRTLETPYNENLLLSSGFGSSGALVGEGTAPPPGRRNEGEIGIQQGVGHWLVADVGYFNKHTTNGYDFGVLFDTPIVFPVSWDHSRLDGFTGRVNLVEHKGVSAFVVMAHTSAIYSPPGTGGVLLEQPDGDFRIDHDQKFNATTNVQYAFAKSVGAWASLNWRYDSGLVAGSVPDYDTALLLTGAQQAAIGLYCGGTFASASSPLTSCESSSRGATRIVIPADGTEDDLTNPPRIAPRHLFDAALGVDNLLHGSRVKLKARVSAVNLANTTALYNFLSTFSGTHFVTPRAYQVQVGLTF